MGRECDYCDNDEYTDENPRVFLCCQRPSDKYEMCCTMAGHKNCLAHDTALPYITNDGGVATADQWNDWIESPEAGKAGFLFLTL